MISHRSSLMTVDSYTAIYLYSIPSLTFTRDIIRGRIAKVQSNKPARKKPSGTHVQGPMDSKQLDIANKIRTKNNVHFR